MINKTLIEEIAREINNYGGRAYYVGGYVRDYLLGRKSKDIDVEVYDVPVAIFRAILSLFGEIDEVGKSFSVLRIKGLDVDFSMPRTEQSTGEGHKDFDVNVNPFLSIEAATRRRDFTINAILMNVLTEEIIDPFNGIKDLNDHIIRLVSARTFIEDPLRVYRACQFAARFNFVIDHDTLMLMRYIDTSSLPSERINEEMKKALLMGERPSLFFKYLRLTHLPMPVLVHLPEDESKFQSAMLRLNEAVNTRDNLQKKDRFLFMYAALHSPGDVNLIKRSLEVDNYRSKDISKVDDLLRGIAAIVHIIEKAADNDKIDTDYLLYKEFSKFKDSLLLYQLAYLYVDLEGKATLYHTYNEYVWRYQTEPRLTGLDLIKAGVPSSKKIGLLLEYANNLWCRGQSYDEIKQETLEYAKELKL